MELQVITVEKYPKNNGSSVTIRCNATAPQDRTQSYNPVLLNPLVINFFFNQNGSRWITVRHLLEVGKRFVTWSSPIGRNEHAGKYYCMARNGYRCTTIGASIPSNTCPGKYWRNITLFDYRWSNLFSHEFFMITAVFWIRTSTLKWDK